MSGERPDGFCRDCQHVLEAVPAGSGRERCPACGSPRLVRHAEWQGLAIAHIDCDAFYAAVEKRDHPEWRDQPLIVGGGQRGVVSTACYIARTRGVRSAMPMFRALALCPEAVVVRPRMARYAEVSRAIRMRMDRLSPLVRMVSIDEAFVDMAGTERVHGQAPAQVLAGFAREIEQQEGLTLSIGLSHTLFLAKLASDMDKPRGMTLIGRAETIGLLAKLPVGRIWGVGAAMQKRLAALGYRTIADLQKAPEAELVRRFGGEGERLSRLARGEDSRRVGDPAPRKSVSSERTLETDVADKVVLARHLRQAAHRVARDLRAKGLVATAVVLKLKSADFRLVSRTRALAAPSQTAGRLAEIAIELLGDEPDGRRYRLVGVGAQVAEMAESVLLPGLDPRETRRRALEVALDRIDARFGTGAVKPGAT